MNEQGKRKRIFTGVDLFELLYVAISIATFSHTVWASSFAFEGTPPTDEAALVLWNLKGVLIAIAIDLGMLLSARFIARNRQAPWSMILAFIIAALSSFYTQLLYILYHTTSFAIGSGVDQYWKENLSPFVDARVVILPFLLPFLGIIYTLARVGREKKAAENEAAIKAQQPIRVSDVLMNKQISVDKDVQALPQPSDDPYIVMDERVQAAINVLGDAQVDLKTLRFYDPHWKAWKGPYETKDQMVKAMITLGKRRATMEANRAKKQK